MPLALVGQALAGDLERCCSRARLLFGLSFGILWVIGPARAAAGGRGASGTGPLIAASGAGWLVGPIVAGVIADAERLAHRLGGARRRDLPLIPLVARYAAPRTTGERLESLRLRAAFGLVRRNRAIAGAALVSALLGVVGGVSGLLLPLALDGNGLSAGTGSGSRTAQPPRSGSRGDARGPAAGLGRASARRRASSSPSWQACGCYRRSGHDARARRVPRRLDRLPGDDQRAQLRRRRTRERGRHRPIMIGV